jgi:hypothetical protein
MDLNMALTGILTGLFLAGAGYFKTRMNTGEPTSWAKAISTAVTGGVVGFLMSFTGIPWLEANFWAQFGLFGVFTVALEDVLKGVFRESVPRLSIEEGVEPPTWSPDRGRILWEGNGGYKVRLNPSIWVRHLPDYNVYQVVTPRGKRYSGDKRDVIYVAESDDQAARAWRDRHP